MSKERFLVTGGNGCIGAWVLRNLVKKNITCAAFDRCTTGQRLKLILSPEEIEPIKFYCNDIADFDAVWKAFEDFQPTHVIHLAAMQLPFCKGDPVLGAKVNVVGTVNMFEAVKRAGLKSLVYASSTAVYGISEEYPEGPLMHDSPLKPRSHYGVYKQANEGTGRVYWMDNGISSIGLRPYVVYGAGRDQGMTSTPTVAMLAAAAGQAYAISYGGKYCFQYADDVARIFIQSARASFKGVEVFNIGGDSISTQQVIAAIESMLPAIRGRITFDDVPLPFPPEVDSSALAKVVGELQFTPLQQGVAETIAIFQKALSANLIRFPL
jgi:nucleoside-diphosphate-sugar epimerase